MKKTPLLLLPGTLCDERLWTHQIQNLEDVVEPVVMPVGTAGSLGALATSILAQAPSTFALAGLSFGGILAFEILRQAPQRITHLALLDTNARADSEIGIAAKREQLAMASTRGLEWLLREKMMPSYLASKHLDDQILVQTIIEMAMDNGLEVFSNQIEATINRPDSLAELAQIGCPTLVLCGKQDQLCPPDRHEEMAAQIPKATLKIIEDCGHMSTLEQPEQVTAAMRQWLIRS